MVQVKHAPRVFVLAACIVIICAGLFGVKIYFFD